MAVTEHCIDHALTAADRAASAKSDLLQTRKATDDGARWLREQAAEKLRETITAAEAALRELGEGSWPSWTCARDPAYCGCFPDDCLQRA